MGSPVEVTVPVEVQVPVEWAVQVPVEKIIYRDRSVSPPSSNKARTVGVGLYLERRSGDRSINVYVERVVPKLFRHFKATRARFRN